MSSRCVRSSGRTRPVAVAVALAATTADAVRVEGRARCAERFRSHALPAALHALRYSLLSARIGSTLAARRAGIQIASIATDEQHGGNDGECDKVDSAGAVKNSTQQARGRNRASQADRCTEKYERHTLAHNEAHDLACARRRWPCECRSRECAERRSTTSRHTCRRRRARDRAGRRLRARRRRFARGRGQRRGSCSSCGRR